MTNQDRLNELAMIHPAEVIASIAVICIAQVMVKLISTRTVDIPMHVKMDMAIEDAVKMLTIKLDKHAMTINAVVEKNKTRFDKQPNT